MEPIKTISPEALEAFFAEKNTPERIRMVSIVDNKRCLDLYDLMMILINNGIIKMEDLSKENQDAIKNLIELLK